MKTENEIKAYIEKLHQQGVRENMAVPPYYRLMWKIGLDIPPPFNQGFWLSALIPGIIFAIFYPLVVWILNTLIPTWDTPTTFFNVITTSTIVGLVMAGLTKWKSKKLDVPEW